jgi:hypothetical protein
VDGDGSSKGQLHYKTDETLGGTQEEEEHLVTGYGNTLKKGEFHVMADLPAFTPPLPCLFANWREYDNIHSLYWAMLDLVWNIDGSIFGVKYGAFWLWTVGSAQPLSYTPFVVNLFGRTQLVEHAPLTLTTTLSSSDQDLIKIESMRL